MASRTRLKGNSSWRRRGELRQQQWQREVELKDTGGGGVAVPAVPPPPGRELSDPATPATPYRRELWPQHSDSTAFRTVGFPTTQPDGSGGGSDLARGSTSSSRRRLGEPPQPFDGNSAQPVPKMLATPQLVRPQFRRQQSVNLDAEDHGTDAGEPTTLDSRDKILLKPYVGLLAGVLMTAASAGGVGEGAVTDPGVLGLVTLLGLLMDKSWSFMSYQAQVRQAERIYQKERAQAEEFHSEEINLEYQHHKDELEREMEQHLQDVTQQLREAQKESDRDLWEQRNTQYQTLMTIDALFLSGAFALVVEGQLPPGVTHRNFDFRYLPFLNRTNTPVVPTYYATLAVGLGCLFVSILLSMALVERMSIFMVRRGSNYQTSLKQMRRIARDMMDHVHSTTIRASKEMTLGQLVEVDAEGQLGHGPPKVFLGVITGTHLDGRVDVRFLSAGQTTQPAHQVDSDEHLGFAQPEALVEKRVAPGRVRRAKVDQRTWHKEKRREFADKLFDQPVIIADWRTLHGGRYTSLFEVWYDKHCAGLAFMCTLLFKLGSFLLLVTLGIYVYAHLAHGEEDEEAHSEEAAPLFTFILISFGVTGFVLLMWQQFKYHYNIKVDNINENGIRAPAEELFYHLDSVLHQNGQIELAELCIALGISPDELRYSRLQRFVRSARRMCTWRQPSFLTPEHGDAPDSLLDGEVSEAEETKSADVATSRPRPRTRARTRSSAVAEIQRYQHIERIHKLLSQHSMLQDAVGRLVEDHMPQQSRHVDHVIRDISNEYEAQVRKKRAELGRDLEDGELNDIVTNSSRLENAAHYLDLWKAQTPQERRQRERTASRGEVDSSRQPLQRRMSLRVREVSEVQAARLRRLSGNEPPKPSAITKDTWDDLITEVMF